MKNPSESHLADQLVSTVSELSSTEELVLFVAGCEGMLPFCQKLLEEYDRGDPSILVQLVNTLCTARGVLPGSLFAETRKVLLALNRFHDADQNHYETLGLASEAGMDEVKKAYRILSKQYHPDTNGGQENSAEKFLEISGAYHAIMAASTHQGASHQTAWRKKRSDHSDHKKRARKKFLVTVFLLVAALTAASIFVAERHNQNIIISQLHSTPPASSPAAGKKTGTGQVKETVPGSSAFKADGHEPQAAPVDTGTPIPVQNKKITIEEILAQLKEKTAVQEDASSVPEHDNEGPEGVPESEQNNQFVEATSDPVPEVPPTTIEVAAQPPVEDQNEEVAADPEPVMQEEETVAVQSPPQPQAPEKGESPAPQQTTDQKKAPTPIAAATIPSPEKEQEQDTTDAVKKESAEKKEQRIQTINTSLEISTLLKEYTKLYNRKELEPFLALFSSDATENGHHITTEVDQYKSLFAHTEVINLDINNISWQDSTNGYTAQADFTTNYTYRNGSKREYTGDISFHLVKESGNLKIKSLDYEFE